MYTPIEYVLTIISLLNLCTAFVIYIVDKREGVSVNSGKHFKSFRVCITMSILFGVASMCFLLRNYELDGAHV
ncbi:hypothetical protein CORT_0B06660 [Candida orthopsilosis Co 90-125]|uniref:Uncharacterized protein n=1 Tax=Candida orthopsilosis (strain 90-125) TaxID=1136231 RepID=H8X1G9_CANO9|nr:hypothetical protein CORT_0B06660 [Candida orthopsilosis Co 90-125]CCG22374.1 hypothetical protein CORT_0B06660 [Candida orthopsilosis Co 90-125]